jgi:hypothetical protein
MKYLGIISVLILFSFFSCKETITTNYNNGKIKERYESKSSKGGKKVRNGKFESFYENGDTMSVMFYRNDTLDGQCYEWHVSGKLSKKYNYTMGKLNGKYTVWNDSGIFEIEYDYVNDTVKNVISKTEKDLLSAGYQKINARVNCVTAMFNMPKYNDGVRNLTAYKNVKDGKLAICFDYVKPKPHTFFLGNSYMSPKAFIRIFDANGEHLAHFYTQERFLPPEDRSLASFKEIYNAAQQINNMIKREKAMGINRGYRINIFTDLALKNNLLVYPVSQRDLEYASIIEFGLCMNKETWYFN